MLAYNAMIDIYEKYNENRNTDTAWDQLWSACFRFWSTVRRGARVAAKPARCVPALGGQARPHAQFAQRISLNPD